MYEVIFYETVTGRSDVLDFLESLRNKSRGSKDARIQYGQLARYIELLQINGTNLPIEIVKHLGGDIWELRPGNNRVFFFCYHHHSYVLLHHYRKKSQKTPLREINRAKAEMNDFISRKESGYEVE